MPGKVYILGAGASRQDTNSQEIPMPLATDFFDNKYIEEYWPGIHYDKKAFVKSDLAKILDSYFSFTINDDNATRDSEPINVEVVFSFLDNFEKIYISNAYAKDIIINAKSQLLQYIHNVILSCPLNADPESMRKIESENNPSYHELIKSRKEEYKKQYSLHNSIAEEIEEIDSILSFNWDLLMDMALWVNGKHHYFKTRDEILNPALQEINSRQNRGYFNNDDTHRGYYLKMHGSVNYAACVNHQCYRYNHPIALDEWDADTPELLQCSYCFSPLAILLLPPHVNKTYKNNRFFKLQAGIAAQKLNIASEIILIGYSLPEFDFEANTLFRLSRLFPGEHDEDSQNFLKKVTIVNPEIKNNEFVRRITSLFGLNDSKKSHGNEVILALFKSVEEYLDIKSKRPTNSSTRTPQKTRVR